jgi:CBS domain-containing protein
MSSVQPVLNQSEAGPKKTVGDVMTTGVVTAHLGAPLKEIAIAMARNRINAVPVINETRQVVGVVSASDLIDQFTRRGSTAPHRRTWGLRSRRATHAATAQMLMTRPAITVTPATSIADAAHVASVERHHFMPVVDGGVLVGCVTAADLNKSYARTDESVREEVESRVVRDLMLLEPTALVVDVKRGVVAMAGVLDTRDVAEQLMTFVKSVPGVVGVRSCFVFREDTGEK